MIKTTFMFCALAMASLFICAERANAQTVGYADAIGRFAVACGKDIDKLCKKTDLGGGRVQQCLDQNQASVSASCKSTMGELRINCRKERRRVPPLCEFAIRTYEDCVREFRPATAI
jgi:hypothetical protein